jgi:H+/gluconate symporter-like permease
VCSPYDSVRRLIKSISAFLLVAIIVAVVDPALAETRTARNGKAVIEYQIDGKGPAVLMIASLGVWPAILTNCPPVWSQQATVRPGRNRAELEAALAR